MIFLWALLAVFVVLGFQCGVRSQKLVKQAKEIDPTDSRQFFALMDRAGSWYEASNACFFLAGISGITIFANLV